MSNPVAWMAHPFSGDMDANLIRAKRWMRWLIRTFGEVDFAADWILWVELLDDSNAAERSRGLMFDEEMCRRCDQLWMVGGEVSSGMEREYKAALAAHRTVFDLTALGPEPPTDETEIVALREFIAGVLDSLPDEPTELPIVYPHLRSA